MAHQHAARFVVGAGGRGVAQALGRPVGHAAIGREGDARAIVEGRAQARQQGRLFAQPAQAHELVARAHGQHEQGAELGVVLAGQHVARIRHGVGLGVARVQGIQARVGRTRCGQHPGQAAAVHATRHAQAGGPGDHGPGQAAGLVARGDQPGAAIGQQRDDVAAARSQVQRHLAHVDAARDLLLPGVDHPDGGAVRVGHVEQVVVTGRQGLGAQRQVGAGQGLAVVFRLGAGDDERVRGHVVHTELRGRAPEHILDRALRGQGVKQPAVRIEGQAGPGRGRLRGRVGHGRRGRCQRDDVIGQRGVHEGAAQPMRTAAHQQGAGVGGEPHCLGLSTRRATPARAPAACPGAG